MDFTCGLFGMPWLWALILIAIVIFFFPGKKGKKESTLEIVDRKFAEGVLSVPEYEERKALLGGAGKR